jgi:hypothetical protein
LKKCALIWLKLNVFQAKMSHLKSELFKNDLLPFSFITIQFIVQLYDELSIADTEPDRQQQHQRQQACANPELPGASGGQAGSRKRRGSETNHFEQDFDRLIICLLKGRNADDGNR